MFCCIDERGQTVVEAAVALPVFLCILGLLLQPAVLVFNRCVMQEAASETCRVLATNTASEHSMRAFALRRLAAIPDIALFHEGGDSGWELVFTGSGSSDVSVKIRHKARPLPLFGVLAGLGGQGDGKSVVQECEARSAIRPDWAAGSPDAWIGAWE